MPPDPSSSPSKYHAVAAELRAQILAGELKPGDRLDTQIALADFYGTARMTIQQALRQLKAEGLITSQQGSGVFVADRTPKPVDVRPHIEEALAQGWLSIDFVGFTAETLYGALSEPLDQIRSRRWSPRTVKIRLLLPDMDTHLSLPAAVDGEPEVSAAARARMAGITAHYTGELKRTIEELSDLAHIPESSVETRVLRGAPMSKIYIINNAKVLTGFYPVREAHITVKDEKRAFYDPMGKDAALFTYVLDDDPESPDSRYVNEVRRWFDSVWPTIAKARP